MLVVARRVLVGQGSRRAFGGGTPYLQKVQRWWRAPVLGGKPGGGRGGFGRCNPPYLQGVCPPTRGSRGGFGRCKPPYLQSVCRPGGAAGGKPNSGELVMATCGENMYDGSAGWQCFAWPVPSMSSRGDWRGGWVDLSHDAVGLSELRRGHVLRENVCEFAPVGALCRHLEADTKWRRSRLLIFLR